MTHLQSDDRQHDGDSTATEEIRTVELPARVADRVERRVEVTDFDSPSTYITFVLEETLKHVEASADDEDVADDVSEEEVRTRLESLGYLE